MQSHSLVSCGLSADYDRHAELLETKKAAAPAYAGRSVEPAAAVAAPVRAVPRTNSRKRAARER